MSISPRDMAREMRQSYFIKYSEICRKRENTHFFHPMIINLFGLIHKSRKVRKLLNEYNDFSLFIDKHYQENCKLYIEDDTDDVTEDNVVDVDYSSDRLNKTPMNVNYDEVKNVSPFSKTK